MMPGCSPARCRTARQRYQLRARFGDNVVELDDPYRFPPVLSDFDLYLLGEGTHQRIYDKLGAHPMTLDGVDGVAFVVLAPNAQRRQRGRRFQFLERDGGIRCGCAASAIGNCSSRTPSAGDHYKFDIIEPQRPAFAAEIRSAGLCRRSAPEDRLDRFRRGQIAASAPGAVGHQRAERADVDLRGPSRLVAAQGRQ